MSVLAEQHRADGTPGRRRLVRGALTGALALGAGLAAGGGSTGGSTRTGPNGPRPGTPEAALRELSAGNARWRTFHERHPDATRTVRQALVGGQHPFAVILGCVDSRVPPELVFDQGLGDLMTVRSAGEVLDDAVLGSIAFGVVELAIPLVVVLGHQSCGAVTAAVRAAEGLEQLPGHLRYLAEQIRPAVDRTLSRDARVDAAVTQNVRLVRSRLAAEPDLAARVAAGRLAVVGARYELTSQRVRRIR
ncbi:carbonic anhydrase [Streptomyces sp. WM6372]|uniref:carbonic anhydrase n=1 Tax=Streptomyces sp. WM6372 TaxID=1415555 RepID=UPI0006ADFB74|nr:carbonic anhydrase [Streptomyces sp. WM6372]KOU27467.1 carbonic anhydrase [Streptomyces sp. WM6372]